MAAARAYHRLNIYLDDSRLRERIKVAAARHGTTLSGYCVAAIRRQLVADGLISGPPDQPATAAHAIDQLRHKIRPVGVPVSELIAVGRG